MRFVAALVITMGSLLFWYKAGQELALRLWGVETKAQIYAASAAVSARRNIASVSFEFTTPDKTLAHGSYFGKRGAGGRSVQIRYLPAHPAINTPADFGYGVAQFGFFGLGGWLLAFWAVRVARPKPEPTGAEQEGTATAPPAEPTANARRDRPRPALVGSLLLSGCLVAAVLAYLRWSDGQEGPADGPGAAPAGLPGAIRRGSSASNAANGNLFGFDGEWLYFARWPKRDQPGAPAAGLYRCRVPDGAAPALVGPPGQTATIFQGISVQGDWVYYVAMQGLCRIRTDGTRHRVLLEQNVNAACVVGDWIYYQLTPDRNRLWRMPLAGGAPKRLTEEEAGDFSVADDGFIYYANKTDGEAIYRIRWDGAGRTKLTDRPARVLLAEAGALWFIDAKTEQLCRLSPADRSCQTIVAAPVSGVSFADGRLYFTSEGQIKRCLPDGRELTTVCPAADLLKFSVHAGRLYFGSWDGSGPIRSVDLDGTSPRSIAR